MPVRWGVVGASGFAKYRAIPEGIIPSRNGSLIAVMSTHEDKIRAVSEELGGVRYYTSSEDMYRDAEVDAVYICTPHNTHLREVMKAAEHGKHVFCEKPLAMNPQEAEQMVRVCRDHNVKLGTALMLRYHPVHLKLKAMIEQGMLGTVVMARAQFAWWYPPTETAWRQDPKAGGGGPLMDVGSHCMDLLEFLLGSATDLCCFADTLVQDFLVEDTAVVTLKFESGAVGVVDTHFCTPVTSPRRLEVFGSRGYVYAIGSVGQSSEGQLFANLPPDGSDDLSQIGERAVPLDSQQNQYQAEFEAFAEAVENNTDPPVGGEVGWRNMQLITAAYQSARTGRLINVERKSLRE